MSLTEEGGTRTSYRELVAQLSSDVASLAVPQGREVGSPTHKAACNFLAKRLSELGVTPYQEDSFEMPYVVKGTNFCNLVGRIKGENSEQNPILLAAHYDTCGKQPGADDNAAACAIVLSCAAELAGQNLSRDVIIAFFDAEEPPHFQTPAMGSTYFHEHQTTEDIHCTVVMDLVGHDAPIPGREDLVILTGIESAQGLEDVLGTCKEHQQLSVLPIPNSFVGNMSDHHWAQQHNRPFLFLTCGHWEHYHMPSDTPEKLNYDKMAAITDLVSSFVVTTSKRELSGQVSDQKLLERTAKVAKELLSPQFESLGANVDDPLDVLKHLSLIKRKYGL